MVTDLEILDFLADAGEQTPVQIAVSFGWDTRETYERLESLVEQGLARKDSLPFRLRDFYSPVETPCFYSAISRH